MIIEKEKKIAEEFHDKLLSHRGRSDNKLENSFEGFKFSLDSGSRFIELDIRVSSDKKFFLTHNTFLLFGFKKINLADKTFDELNELWNKKYSKDITNLEDVLEYFSKNRMEDQILGLDLKEFGYEEEILTLLKKYDLLNYSYFWTWTPQIVFKLDEIFKKENIKIPIYLSHTRVDSFFKPFIPMFLRFVKTFIVLPFNIVLIGDKNYKKDLGKYKKGYWHMAFFWKLPKDLINVLKKHNGGICITARTTFNAWIDKKFFTKMKNLGLKVSVFGPFYGLLKINTKEKFERFAKMEEVDIVFMDDLEKIRK